MFVNCLKLKKKIPVGLCSIPSTFVNTMNHDGYCRSRVDQSVAIYLRVKQEVRLQNRNVPSGTHVIYCYTYGHVLNVLKLYLFLVFEFENRQTSQNTVQ